MTTNQLKTTGHGNVEDVKTSFVQDGLRQEEEAALCKELGYEEGTKEMSRRILARIGQNK